MKIKDSQNNTPAVQGVKNYGRKMDAFRKNFSRGRRTLKIFSATMDGFLTSLRDHPDGFDSMTDEQILDFFKKFLEPLDEIVDEWNLICNEDTERALTYYVDASRELRKHLELRIFRNPERCMETEEAVTEIIKNIDYLSSQALASIEMYNYRFGGSPYCLVEHTEKSIVSGLPIIYFEDTPLQAKAEDGAPLQPFESTCPVCLVAPLDQDFSIIADCVHNCCIKCSIKMFTSETKPWYVHSLRI